MVTFLGRKPTSNTTASHVLRRRIAEGDVHVRLAAVEGMLAQGASVSVISYELGVTVATVNRDVAYLRKRGRA